MRKSLTLMVVVVAVIALTAGCKNKPPDIPARPAGPDSVTPGIDEEATYQTFASDPNQDQIMYIFDWGDNSADTTGYYDSGDTAQASHAWTDTGAYEVKALAEDDKGNQSADWSDALTVVVSEQAPSLNDPPDAPDAPSGPDSGALGEYHAFSTMSTDPDGDSVRIRFVWGDGTVSAWSPFVPNGTSVTDSVYYISGGTKMIRAVAMDVDSAISDTSDAKEFGIINTAPDAPVVSGPARGIQDGPYYRFGAQSTDPEGDSIQYKFFWGDGNSSDWTASVNSGQTGRDSWRYSALDSFPITAIARDQDGAESDTSEPFYHQAVGEGEVIWGLSFGDAFTSSPAIATLVSDGEDRVGIVIGFIEGALIGLDAYQGSQIFVAGELGMENFNSSPAIGDNGRIYIGNENGALYAFSNEGDTLWAIPDSLSDDDMGTTPAVDGDMIYVGGEHRMFYAVQDLGASGSELWSYHAREEISSSPAIGPDGSIIFTDDSGYVYSYDAAGSPDWTYIAESTNFTSSPAVGSDGTVYIGTEQGKLLAISSSGALSWQYATPLLTTISGSPVICANGDIIFGGEDGLLYRLDATGDLVSGWPLNIGAQISSTPAIAADGVLYLLPEDNKLYAIDMATPQVNWSVTLTVPVDGRSGARARTMAVDDLWPSPVIDAYGIIYIASGEDGIFAIAGRSAGTLGATAWPMFHHDIRHTGKSGTW